MAQEQGKKWAVGFYIRGKVNGLEAALKRLQAIGGRKAGIGDGAGPFTKELVILARKTKPGRACSICEHTNVDEINALLLQGETYRNISKRFSVSAAALSRHKNQHIPRAMAKAKEAAAVVHGDNLLTQVQELQEKAASILSQAEAAGDLRTALTGIREARACLELLAKLQGELAQEGTINITMAPEWLELRAVILNAVEPWPQAGLAIAEAVTKHAGP